MSKKDKKVRKFYESKYFKWGFTAFVSLMLTALSVYFIFHFGDFKGAWDKFFNVMAPVIDGLIIAYLINPIMRFFEVRCMENNYIKHGLKVGRKEKRRFRVIALIVSLVLVVLAVYLFFKSVLPQLVSSVETLINNFPTYYNNVVNYVNDLPNKYAILNDEEVIAYFDEYSSDLSKFVTGNIFPGVKDMIMSLSSSVISAVGALVDLVIGIIIGVYIVANKEKYVGMAKKIIYSVMSREKANDLMVDLRFIDKTFGGFLIGKIIDSIIIGILCFIGLSILKVPFAVLVSVIVGVTNVIPFFGPYLGAIPSAFIILLIDPRKCLVFLIFLVILQQLDGNFIGPAILGNSIGVSSFWIIVSITVFGGFFGVPGMLIGVPCFACAYAFIRRRVNNRLIKKGMSIATYDYARTSYVADDNSLVFIGDLNSPVSHNTRYIELNPSAGSDKKSGKTIMNKLKDICVVIGNRIREWFIALIERFKKK